MPTKELTMRRLLAFALPAVLLLTAAPTAAAKGVTSAKVCGSDGCRSIAGAREQLLANGPPTAGPEAAEPFVRFELRVGVPGHSELVEQTFLPHAGLVLFEDGAWAAPLALTDMRAQARRVTPLPASALPTDAFDAPAQPGPSPAPAAARQPAADAVGSGPDATWWLAIAAGVVALGAGVVLARRRRRDGTGRVAGAAG
jgi:LPXTG-motif cell wall-anchored protein